MGRALAANAASTALGPAEVRRRVSRRPAPPLEHRILVTAALCLLAFGAVMVYSASSPLGVLSGKGGTGTGEFVRYLIFGGLGLFCVLLGWRKFRSPRRP